MSEGTAIARRILLILSACFSPLAALGFYMWFWKNEGILVFAVPFFWVMVLFVVGINLPRASPRPGATSVYKP